MIRFWIVAGLGVAVALGLFYADFLRGAEFATTHTTTPTHPPSRGRRGGGRAGRAPRCCWPRGHGGDRAGPGGERRAGRPGAAARPCSLGDVPPDGLLTGFDEVVVSPGVPPHAPAVAAARAVGVPVYSEPELAWRLRGPGHHPGWPSPAPTARRPRPPCWPTILRAAGRRTAALGNIGEPLVFAATLGRTTCWRSSCPASSSTGRPRWRRRPEPGSTWLTTTSSGTATSPRTRRRRSRSGARPAMAAAARDRQPR